MGSRDEATRDIGDIVLGTGARERPGRMAIAWVAAAVVHALLLFALRGTEGAHSVTQTPQTVQVVVRDYELHVASPPPPIAPLPERAMVERHVRARAIQDRSAAPAAAPEVARAASVIAPQPDPGAPVDLTDDAVVTGQATAYAGGVTSSAGTNTSPGRIGLPASKTSDAIGATAIDYASPVSLENEKWSCPWPREADSEQIDEQTVILRVVVGASGVAEKAAVVADPGHGFGAAAVACALRTRFVPARGRSGQPVRATSPPIRVRFTR